MPIAKSRGYDIYYEIEGDGPLLVLQHGIFRDQRSWKDFGYVDGLKDRFTVATIDSLGHGQSDKPPQSAPYRVAERAGDVVAVMDALGAERAHVMGYSMGGWIAVGVAIHFPDRLASLAVGGWDCVDGMNQFLKASGGESVSFESFVQGARRALPADVMAWVNDDVTPGLTRCFEELFDIEGGEQAVLNLEVPVLLWAGSDDPYHEPMLAFADENGFDFLTVPGDHVDAEVKGAALLVPAVKKRLGA